MQETIQNCGFISHNSDCITRNCLLYSFYTFLCRAWISSVHLYTSQKHKISGLTLTFNWLPVERTVVLIWEFQARSARSQRARLYWSKTEDHLKNPQQSQSINHTTQKNKEEKFTAAQKYSAKQINLRADALLKRITRKWLWN